MFGEFGHVEAPVVAVLGLAEGLQLLRLCAEGGSVRESKGPPLSCISGDNAQGVITGFSPTLTKLNRKENPSIA